MSHPLTEPRPGVLVAKETSPHWNGKMFENSTATEISGPGALWSVLKNYWKRPKGAGKPAGKIPVHKLSKSSFSALADPDLAITWLGHAGFLVEIEGSYVLMDPMLGPNPSPIYGTGPGRQHEPPCNPEDLPAADVVIISHDHYDHLDARTIKALAITAKLFAVPIGVGKWLRHFGVPLEKIVELDWDQSYPVGNIRVHCLPARHFTGRGLTDRMKTLWGSFAIVGQKRRVYFGGDSGEQNEAYDQIGQAFGPFDAALLPIGAYDPLWHDIHINPEEAVQAFERLDGGLFIPCHWATFDLAVHGWANPALRLAEDAQKANIPLCWPEVGQRFKPEAAPKAEWWRPLLNSVNAGM